VIWLRNRLSDKSDQSITYLNQLVWPTCLIFAEHMPALWSPTDMSNIHWTCPTLSNLSDQSQTCWLLRYQGDLVKWIRLNMLEKTLEVVSADSCAIRVLRSICCNHRGIKQSFFWLREFWVMVEVYNIFVTHVICLLILWIQDSEK
jgi:hypothetical protein